MLANGLSLLRVVLAPAVLYGLRGDAGSAVGPATLGLLVAAGVTDVLDGLAARRLGETSQLGRILDPLADKLFIGCVAAGLVLWRGFPPWLLALQVGRDAAIVGTGAVLLRRRRVVIGASRLGKAATSAMALTMLAYALAVPAALAPALAAATGALLIGSAVGYLRQLLRLLRPQPPAAAGPSSCSRCEA